MALWDNHNGVRAVRRIIAGGVATALFCAVMFITFPTTVSSLPQTSTPPSRGGGIVSRIEGHCSVGVTAPSKTWFLPEGSSAWGFECWLLIQNPNASQADCTVTYMIEGEGPKSVTKSVPAKSRKSFSMQEDIGNKDASIKVESNLPVIPERAMYRNDRREGHDSIGTTSPAGDFYLAEGTSDYGFTTYVLIQNPNSEPSDVTVTYMTGNGPQPQAPFTMEPNSRKTIRVNDVLPNTDFSTKVSGTKPIIAERSMYWDNGTGEACHDSIGVSSPANNWYLAEGCTNGGFETWVLVQNPSNVPATANITYMTETGPEGGPTLLLEPNTRQSVNVADTIPNNSSVSTKVTSDQPVIAERSMYWNGRMGGHNSLGASQKSKKWYLAEGCTNGGFETWVLIQNPGPSPAKVDITYMTDTGPKTRPSISLAANTRKTVNVADTLPECWNVSTEISSTSPIIAERSMYWSKRLPSPSFTSDDYPSTPGLTYNYLSGYDKGFNYPLGGPWELSLELVLPTESIEMSYINPATNPAYENFSGSNTARVYTEKGVSYSQFYNKDSSSISWLGYSAPDHTFKFDPPSLSYRFPFNVGDSWGGVSNFDLYLPGQAPVRGTYETEDRVLSNNSVTLIIGADERTYDNCYLIYSHEYQRNPDGTGNVDEGYSFLVPGIGVVASGSGTSLDDSQFFMTEFTILSSVK